MYTYHVVYIIPWYTIKAAIDVNTKVIQHMHIVGW